MTLRVCLMVEGQEDVTWEQWLALARACEEHGLEGLFRSDHYAPIGGPADGSSLDAWATISALAARTEGIRLGTLVSPVTFRHPSVLAKMVVAADHVSGGRVELGMGAGWYHGDHDRFGFEFSSTAVRMRMLAEQLEIVHRQWHGERFSFEGHHYRLRDCVSMPTPVQDPHPPLIVGGSAGAASARLAAIWADEYNTVFASPDECGHRRTRVADAWEREGRDPSTLRFSLMTGCIVGKDRDEVLRRAGRVADKGGDHATPDDFLRQVEGQWVVGNVDQAVARLQALSEAGVDRIMLQHLAHDDLEMVALIGREVVPAVA
jgi:F420-dependent oxidoreductase-like protein